MKQEVANNYCKNDKRVTIEHPIQINNPQL